MTGRAGVRLVYDSDRTAAKVGRRSAPACDRTLLFRSDRFAVDLVVQPAADELRIFHGQIVDERAGSPVSRAAVHLGDGDAAVRTDDFGQFSLSDIPGAGDTVLRVRLPEQELRCAIPQSVCDG